jgi:hypothetical protein
MCAKWNNNKVYDPEHLAVRLEESKSLKQDGSVSFNGFGFTEYIVVLNSMVSLNKTITEYEKNNIVRHAAFSLAKKGKITSADLLKEINELENKSLKLKPKKFVIISTLSINRFCKLKRAKVNGATITFHSSLPKRFSKVIEDTIKKPASYTITGDYPQDYIYLKTSVEAKSHSQASSIAIESIDFIRGIWNFFYNRGQFRVSLNSRNPVNSISFGPLHTTHHPNGKLATKTWLYETGYMGPLRAFDLKNKEEDLYKFQNKVRMLLRKNKLKNRMEAALRRYAQALDIRDWESSYLRLWGLLEYLTNTNENESHKDTVKRTSFFFKERDYARQVLNHLRDHRNRAVHTGKSNQNIETLLYQLKEFVEAMLEFQIVNKFNFSSHEELTQFMNLPEDVEELNKRQTMINNALKFMDK